jgi:hypothetical protein
VIIIYNSEGGVIMIEISKIVIKGTSGYCCADEAYSDKVTVTEESIAYEYHPIFESNFVHCMSSESPLGAENFL